MTESGCVKCPVTFCNAEYRGSQCAALRAKAGVDFDPKTNADRIRAMSDEELAMMFTCSPCQGLRCDDAPKTEYGSVDCFQCQMNWLRQPAEGEQYD